MRKGISMYSKTFGTGLAVVGLLVGGITGCTSGHTGEPVAQSSGTTSTAATPRAAETAEEVCAREKRDTPQHLADIKNQVISDIENGVPARDPAPRGATYARVSRPEAARLMASSDCALQGLSAAWGVDVLGWIHSPAPELPPIRHVPVPGTIYRRGHAETPAERCALLSPEVKAQVKAEYGVDACDPPPPNLRQGGQR